MASVLRNEDEITAQVARAHVQASGASIPVTLSAQLQLVESVAEQDDLAGAGVVVLVTPCVDERTAGAVSELLEHGAGHVVLVALTVDSSGALAALGAGASAVMRRRDATPARLADAVAAAAHGDSVVPRDLLGELFAPSRNDGCAVTVADFTSREIDVLRLVADGYGTDEIAKKLAYSERTVKNVLHDVTTRFNLRTRSHAVAFAMRAGVL